MYLLTEEIMAIFFFQFAQDIHPWEITTEHYMTGNAYMYSLTIQGLINISTNRWVDDLAVVSITLEEVDAFEVQVIFHQHIPKHADRETYIGGQYLHMNHIQRQYQAV